jgi:mannose-6-phosphate isomerase-like protein (cupin superfamily)
MSDTIRNLGDGRPFDPRGVLTGAWSNFEIKRLEPGEKTSFIADRSEHAFYVLRGAGSARSERNSFDLEEGTAVTIPRGDRVEVEARSPALEIFICTLDV